MRPQLKFKSFSKRAPDKRLIAVIDIGSNSVRLVVFKGLKRNPQIVFNERVLCGLGRSISNTGCMDDEAIKSAVSTLKRFAFLCDDMDVDEVEVIATAAVREAKNSDEFIKQIRSECGFKIKVISGKEEANLAALAVISAFPNVTGIVGDLGGGSLELAFIKNDEIVDEVSLPIGPLRFLDEKTELSREDKTVIKNYIAEIPWLKWGKGYPFYMVGGAWRVLSKLHLKSNEWPIPILHSYQVSADDMQSFAKKISKKSARELKEKYPVKNRRLPILPAGAYILKTVLKNVGSSQVICSSQGIREGVHFKKLNHKVRKKDPFIEACKEIADKTGRFPEHAHKLFSWMNPLFENESDGNLRLCFGCCLLSDISWQGHPDFRAKIAYDNTFYGHFLSLDHKARAMVSTALYLSYRGPINGKNVQKISKVLSEKSFNFSKILGAVLRLGQKLTGGSSKPLEYTSLKLDESYLTLNIPFDHKDLGGENIESRLESIAKMLGVKPMIQIIKQD